MKIVHIGAAEAMTMAELAAIKDLRTSGHDVYVADGDSNEQLVRRILDADEIHVWDIGREFELGMIYFYSVHALHYKLHWRVRLLGDGRRDGKLAQVFRAIAGVCLTCGGRGRVRHWYAMDELGWKDCGDCGQ